MDKHFSDQQSDHAIIQGVKKMMRVFWGGMSGILTPPVLPFRKGEERRERVRGDDFPSYD